MTRLQPLLIAPLLAAALLSGCADVPRAPQAQTSPAALQALRTSDPDEIRRRFGGFENLAGQQYMGAGNNPVILRDWRWSVPGVQLQASGMNCYERTGKCDTVSYTVQYDPAQRRLLFANSENVVYQTGVVNADGTVTITRGKDVSRASFDYDTGEMVYSDIGRWSEIGRQDYAKLTSTWEESDSQVRREERLARRRESEETARNINRAIQAFGQAYRETAQSYQQQQADRSASLRAAQQMAQARQEAAARQRAVAESAARARAEAASRQIVRPTSTQLAQAPLTPLPAGVGSRTAPDTRAQPAPSPSASTRTPGPAPIRPAIPQIPTGVNIAIANPPAPTQTSTDSNPAGAATLRRMRPECMRPGTLCENPYLDEPTKPAPTVSQAPGRDGGGSRTGGGTGGGTTRPGGGSDGSQDTPGKGGGSGGGDNQRQPDPRLKPYPEAIVVCTIPNEKGQFRCEGPTSRESGCPTCTPSQNQSPERLVASWTSSCKDARRLRSATHMVWGCGFAATGLFGYIDRGGPGVDAQDRRTYYCHERQSSCRRTEP